MTTPKKLLDDTLTQQLASLVTRITHNITLTYSLDDRPESRDCQQLLTDIAALSDHITTVHDDNAHDRKPSFTIARTQDTHVAVTFAGLPMGHEFSSLVLALLQVGGNPVKEDPELIEQVCNLEGKLDFVTYMSLSCQNCPAVVQALNTMAVLNPNITHTAVEGSLFQEEIQEKNIQAVPSIYLNGELYGQGRTTIEDFVRKLDANSAEREAQKLNNKKPYDTLVIGQGAAGATASIYLARKGLRVGLVGQRFGGQVLDTMAIENFISMPYTEGPKLAAAFENHVNDYDIDVIKSQTATALHPAKTQDELHTVFFGDNARLTAKRIIIATGAQWRLMGVPGENEYRNKGVTFCPHCDGPLFKGKDIAVIGGGNSGIEAAIDLAGIVKHVTVLEFGETCRADDVLLNKLRSLPNVDIITNAATTEILGDTHTVTGLAYTDRLTGESKKLSLSGVFIQIGLVPNTQWLADSGIELNHMGEVIIDDHGATNIPGIFAAGDCSSVAFKQIIIAEGTGATAALSAWEHSVTH